MNELDKAMAEFLAKNQPVIVPPVLDAKTHKEVRKQSWLAQKERQRDADAAERAERNAENKRYDAEGVYYIGGKL